MTKAQLLLPQIESLVAGEYDMIAKMASVSATLSIGETNNLHSIASIALLMATSKPLMNTQKRRLNESSFSGQAMIEYDPELDKLIRDAEALMRELDVFDELDGDLLERYYNKCKEMEKK